jgi:acetolactate synthase-1/2/3 large subunit
MEVYVEKDFAQVPPFRPEPEMERVKEAVRILSEAKKPVIVSGGGVRASGAGRELVALAEKLQIPVATTLTGKDTIPGNHPLSVGVVGTYSRISANRIVSEADLIFYAGSETGGMTTHFWQVPPIGTPTIQLDINSEQLGRNYPLKAAVMGDAKVSLQKMIDEADTASAGSRKPWVERAQSAVAEWRSDFEALLNSDAAPLRVERICKELTDFLPSDAMVLADTGHSGMWMGGMFDLTDPGQSYTRSFGHLGWAFSAGLGAKCALPDRPVLTFTGDSGFWYHIGEIETAVRWKINAVTLVNNNGAGNQSKRGFDAAYGGEQTEQAREMWVLSKVNFAKIAEDMGAVGIRVEKPGELKGALQQAFEANAPVVIDVVSDIECMAPLAWAP